MVLLRTSLYVSTTTCVVWSMNEAISRGQSLDWNNDLLSRSQSQSQSQATSEGFLVNLRGTRSGFKF